MGTDAQAKVKQLLAGTNNYLLATVSGVATWAAMTAAIHGDLTGGSLHAAVSNTAAGFMPQVSGTAGALPYSTGSAIAYETQVRRLAAGSLSFGSTPSGTGVLRGPSSMSVYGYTSDDHPMLGLSSGALTLGDSTLTTNIYAGVKTGGVHYWQTNGTTYMQHSATTGLVVRYNTNTYAQILPAAGSVTHAATINGETANNYIVAGSTSIYFGNSSPNVTTYLQASTTLYADIGGNHAWTATASQHLFNVGANLAVTIGGNELRLTRDGDATTYSYRYQYADNVVQRLVISGGTDLIYLQAKAAETRLRADDASGVLYGYVNANATQVWSASATAAVWGDAANVTTTSIAATTTVKATVGSNDAWEANATAQGWKIGANTCASLGATNAVWGDSTNVVSTHLRATTNLYGTIGGNNAWQATATAHTWKIGATTNLVLGDNYLAVGTGNMPDSGNLRLANGDAITFRNAGNDGNVQALSVSGFDNVHVGDTSDADEIYLDCSTTLYGRIGANAAWTATATAQTWKIGANDAAKLNANYLYQYRDGDTTTYAEQRMYADAVAHSLTVSSTGPYQFFYASHSTVNLGNATSIATTLIRASTTINADIASNHAWQATASVQDWKIGSTTVFGLTSTYVNSELAFRFKEVSDPGTPASGYAYLYLSASDGHFWLNKDDTSKIDLEA